MKNIIAPYTIPSNINVERYFNNISAHLELYVNSMRISDNLIKDSEVILNGQVINIENYSLALGKSIAVNDTVEFIIFLDGTNLSVGNTINIKQIFLNKKTTIDLERKITTGTPYNFKRNKLDKATKEKLEQDQKTAEEKARRDREEQERLEKANREKEEKNRKEREERERLEREKLEKERQKKETMAKVEKEGASMLANLFEISDRVNLNDVASMLDIERAELLKKLIEWRKILKFKIDGDYIKVEKEDISNLLNLLDSSYQDWNSDKKKTLKKE